MDSHARLSVIRAGAASAQNFVHCAGAITMQVESQILKSGGGEAFPQPTFQGHAKRQVQLGRRDFESNLALVQAYANLTEAERAHDLFSTVDHCQAADGN